MRHYSAIHSVNRKSAKGVNHEGLKKSIKKRVPYERGGPLSFRGRKIKPTEKGRRKEKEEEREDIRVLQRRLGFRNGRKRQTKIWDTV